jgi:hypothetical protein
MKSSSSDEISIFSGRAMLKSLMPPLLQIFLRESQIKDDYIDHNILI